MFYFLRWPVILFIQDLGWLSPEQREAMSQENSAAGAPSATGTSGADGAAANSLDRALSTGSNGIGSSTAEGLAVGDQGDGYSRPGTTGARSRGGRPAGSGALERGGGGRSQGAAGRIGGGGGGGGHGGRGKGGVPKRDRDGGRGGGGGGGVGGGRGPGGAMQPAFRGYDFSQAPPSMGAYQGQPQREGGGGSGGGRGGGGGGSGGVFNPFLAPGTAGSTASAGGRGGGVGMGGVSL